MKIAGHPPSMSESKFVNLNLYEKRGEERRGVKGVGDEKSF